MKPEISMFGGSNVVIRTTAVSSVDESKLRNVFYTLAHYKTGSENKWWCCFPTAQTSSPARFYLRMLYSSNV